MTGTAPLRVAPVAAESRVPDATVARLPVYLRVLHGLAEAGQGCVASAALASAAGVNPAKLRKDLSYLGSCGTRGVGYDVTLLVERIGAALGLVRSWPVVLVGVGHLGQALAGYPGFASRGFRIVALLDADPARVGERVGALAITSVDRLEVVVAHHQVSIAMLATPAAGAQRVVDRLVAAGVTSILNFAPVHVTVPEGVDVRKVDLAVELQILSFLEHRKSQAAGAAQPKMLTVGAAR